MPEAETTTATTPSGRTRARNLLRRVHPATVPVLLGAAGLAAATMVHFVDPHEPGHYPVCPWLLLTGTFCPGCGTMRGVNALTNGDILGALRMNAFTMMMLPVLGYGYVVWLYRSFRPKRSPGGLRIPAVWLYLFLGVLLAFWLVRNLPFGSVLAPPS
ncbi:uncharacterized protein DUF2752 [Haloactinospora alba]|uniref:Uncharacterized protein DUF2752 n=1 Tax=Haloactinospora alba TaxID=405555 RepID=A0A543NHX7_9ACTN|nr:DUF2752 domain-containing protein [Haloactinospora alba]TQN31453.1 uncharacterized protein DUF2752 [Haloactinospora alba]